MVARSASECAAGCRSAARPRAHRFESRFARRCSGSASREGERGLGAQPMRQLRYAGDGSRIRLGLLAFIDTERLLEFGRRSGQDAKRRNMSRGVVGVDKYSITRATAKLSIVYDVNVPQVPSASCCPHVSLVIVDTIGGLKCNPPGPPPSLRFFPQSDRYRFRPTSSTSSSLGRRPCR
jgi:hypothetical protein